MSNNIYLCLVAFLGAAFAICFAVIVVPPLIQSGDVLGAFVAGFVNPFSTGYSLDVIICALILFVWIFYERATLKIKHGFWAVPLSIIPGVAVGFAFYLIVRNRQVQGQNNS